MKVNSFYIGTLQVNLPSDIVTFFLERVSVSTKLNVLKFLRCSRILFNVILKIGARIELYQGDFNNGSHLTI